MTEHSQSYPVTASARQTAWLIEWPEDDNVPVRWWNPATGWVRDANKAMHFVRKQDAEDFISAHARGFVVGIKPTEHVFLGTCPVAQAAPEPVAWRWPINSKFWSLSARHPGDDIEGVQPLYALSSTDPRCTCAAIVNPNIPHARSCPLSSAKSGGAS